MSLNDRQSTIRQRLIGTWKLVSTEQTLKDGSTRPFPQFGPRAVGFLMYQADGYMSAFLAHPDRTNEAFAYCGRYEIDVERKQIIHLPEIATNPSFVGSRQVRPFELDGNRLILSDLEKEDPEVVRWKIVWEKVP